MKIERWNTERGQFEDFRLIPVGPPRFYFVLTDGDGFPVELKGAPPTPYYATSEEAEIDALDTLDLLSIGGVAIWGEIMDVEGNGDNWLVREYRREKSGPPKTFLVDEN